MMPRVVKGSSAVGLTGMSMLRSAEGNGRQAREPNMASKAPAQPAAQNACAANPAAAAAAAAPEAGAPEAMDVDGVHADASLPASPSLHACMGFKPEWRQPFCAHYPFVLHDGAQPLPWSVTLPEGRFIAGDCLGQQAAGNEACHNCMQLPYNTRFKKVKVREAMLLSARARAHTHIHTHTHTQTRTHTKLHTRTRAYTHNCTLTHLHTQLHNCTHTHTHAPAHAHAHTHRRIAAAAM